MDVLLLVSAASHVMTANTSAETQDKLGLIFLLIPYSILLSFATALTWFNSLAMVTLLPLILIFLEIAEAVLFDAITCDVTSYKPMHLQRRFLLGAMVRKNIRVT